MTTTTTRQEQAQAIASVLNERGTADPRNADLYAKLCKAFREEHGRGYTTCLPVAEQIARLEREAERTRRLIADPQGFSTYDPHALLAYQEGVLRYAHCAPEGAVILAAPLQGWDGEPMGVRLPQGPQCGAVNPAVRKARAKHGLDPISAEPV